MVFRRRYRRCCYNRAIIVLLTLFSTLSTVTFTYNYISNTFAKPWNDDERVYLVDRSDLDDARIKPSPSYELLPKEFFNTTHLACHYPKLTIDNEEVWKYLQPVTRSRPECEKSTNWVYVENGRYTSNLTSSTGELALSLGTFRLASVALRKHGAIVCAYRPILRSKDDFSTMEGARLFPIVDKMPLVSDFFRADCRARDGSFYSNIHSGIMFDAGLHRRFAARASREDKPSSPCDRLASRHIWNPMARTHLGYNVLMFGFDSVSRMTFMRFLPKSYHYLIRELGSVVMKGRASVRAPRLALDLFSGYNIVGDGTPAALLPILTGKTEQELPEARRGQPDAQTVDRFPWIWKKFRGTREERT